ncbi:hypothetical protein CR513_49801, partial [Mucuna pruriens]
MEENIIRPQILIGRVRIKKKRNSLEGTIVPRRGNKSHHNEVSKVNNPNPNTKKSRNIKCFKCLGKGHITSQCPNKQTMILKDDDGIDNESSHEESSTSGSEEYYSDVSFQGDLMVRRLMSTFIEDDQSQWENIFHSRCVVKGSNVNIASCWLMEKLELPTIPRPKPYKL